MRWQARFVNNPTFHLDDSAGFGPVRELFSERDGFLALYGDSIDTPVCSFYLERVRVVRVV